MLNILVIDDNVQLQIAFKKALMSAGYRVCLASDGEQGLNMVQTAHPDVVLLDLLLPKMSGVEVLRALKVNPETESIPVIALSGLPQANAPKLKEEGAVSYLEKSQLEDSSALLRAIDYALLLPRSDEFRPDAFQSNRRASLT